MIKNITTIKSFPVFTNRIKLLLSNYPPPIRSLHFYVSGDNSDLPCLKHRHLYLLLFGRLKNYN